MIPIGTPTTSVGAYIAECQRVLESMKGQGIVYEMHGYGTNLEGPFMTVSRAIERCHEAVHAMGVGRIATDIRIGTRVDKPAPSVSSSETRQPDPTSLGPSDEDWAKGLSENQRKKQSVLRRLEEDFKG
ncbi:hypothetical protein IE53DRAFT_139761 [Violaceomyces palustris]|uniref:Uncharacterized protein n=1 Tax=Violaceomyces palustris TaxID=1673888 RepID=A0ACD0NUU5_9BASI|nr:hypothetical protein IE53DRAFT_139761 [Violaceomyces palustris]